MGSRALSVRALSVESAEEGAELAEEGAVGGVNLSDFCRYYQQPTNNTPKLMAAPCAQQRPLLPRRVHRHECDGRSHCQCGGAQCGDSIAC